MSEAVAEKVSTDVHPFVHQMVVQLRALDSYGSWDDWSDEKVVGQLILTKEQRREMPVIGDPDETIIAKLKAYYNALAYEIEKQCGVMAVPYINITHEGFGRSLITVGKLVVVDKVLRDVHRFSFLSMEKMCEEADKIIGKAVNLIESHKDVAKL